MPQPVLHIQLPPLAQAPRSQAARSAPPPAAYAKKGKRARFPFLLCSERLISARSAFSLFFAAHVPCILKVIHIHTLPCGTTFPPPPAPSRSCALPGFVDSKNEEKTERNAGYLVVSQSGGGMLRQGTRKGIRRTPANRGMRAHRIVKSLDISEDVCHGLCP